MRFKRMYYHPPIVNYKIFHKHTQKQNVPIDYIYLAVITYYFYIIKRVSILYVSLNTAAHV